MSKPLIEGQCPNLAPVDRVAPAAPPAEIKAIPGDYGQAGAGPSKAPVDRTPPPPTNKK